MAHGLLAGVELAMPAGVRLIDLAPHHDARGCLTELFRQDWDPGIEPVQWNMVRSEASVLRGVHVHLRHDDYLTVAHGCGVIGLCDLRTDSPTRGLATRLTLDANRPQAIMIPHGVAHGFYFPVPSLHIYGVTCYWDPDDELGCHWADPDLGIGFPCDAPALSPRDAGLPPLAVLLETLRNG